MAAPAVTAMNTMVTRVANILSYLNIFPADATNEPILWINHAIETVQRQFSVLEDDFVFNTTATTDFQVDVAAPYPYEIKDVWYNITTNQKPLTWASRTTIAADIANADTVVYRYTVFRDGDDTKLRLNAPAGVITGGLTIRGPYLPVYIAAGANLPFEQKYDEAIEAIAVQRGVYSYTEDTNKRGFADAQVKVAIERLSIAGN